jgi:hypothetical protein
MSRFGVGDVALRSSQPTAEACEAAASLLFVLCRGLSTFDATAADGITVSRHNIFKFDVCLRSTFMCLGLVDAFVWFEVLQADQLLQCVAAMLVHIMPQTSGCIAVESTFYCHRLLCVCLGSFQLCLSVPPTTVVINLQV